MTVRGLIIMAICVGLAIVAILLLGHEHRREIIIFFKTLKHAVH